MQLICISRGSYEYGKDVAKRLAEKMGYACVSRESITDSASDYGIPVGKLEVEILKNRPLSEEMAIRIDLFKAFVIMKLAERAFQERGIVYHGRTGHLVLPGISHVLRVRTVADMKYRIWTTMNRTHLPREKARQYIEQVDEDIRRWVRVLYNENLEDPSLFDVTVNAGSLSVENTAQALLEFPGLPEFQATPASIQNLEDILLAARCRLAIGKDGRTHAVKATVHAERGKILVTYLPRQAREAESIPSILETMEGVESVHCTMATTNILYLGERFEPRSESFEHLIQISEKWNAAIELARFKCEPADAAVGNGTSPEDSPEPPGGMAPKPAGTATEPNGGIMDDDEGPARSLEMDPDASETMHRLIQAGRAGGFHYFRGDVSHPHGGLIGSGNYSLVVVGSVFASKGGASKRLKRDLVSLLSEKFRVPVIGTEELKSRYLFGRKQFLGLLACAAISFLIYSLLFEYQEPVLNFISKGHFDGGTAAKILAALAVGMFVPLVALTVGGLYKNVLKLIKLE